MADNAESKPSAPSVEEALAAPAGFKAVYARIAKAPAEPSVLSDLLGLIGYAVTPEAVASWSLKKRVQGEAYAANEHLRASDNILRKHPRPEWLPEPWKGPSAGGVFSFASGTPLTADTANV